MSAILIIIAVILFVLRAFGVGDGHPDIGWLGLAVWAATALVGYVAPVVARRP